MRPGYVDRNKLQNWSDIRASQSELPRLVRRLVLETTPGLVELGIPAGDGVAAGGWDGSVRTTEATVWVPEGLSVWELSVNASPNTKANDDYSKRATTPDGTATKDCTYVEAILRPWTARADWARTKQADRVWKSVRAIGLDDIETWLEAAPITWAWLSEELGLSPYGLRTGSTWWRNWEAQTNPVLTPDVVLAGRAETAKTLEVRLAANGSITTVAGASADEVYAFVAAMSVQLDEQGKGQMLARLAFVDDLSTWRQLTASPQSLILVPCTQELAQEIPAGTTHNFIIPVPSKVGADVTIPALDAAEVAAALGRAGIEDRAKADLLGRLARRSLTGLRRSIALNPALQRPTWADISPSRHIRSIMLAGSWSDDAEGDRDILELLTGSGYESFREAIAGVTDSPSDPLVMRTDGVWHLVSAVDAWMLLEPKLTHDDMKRFESIIESVLAEGDPALELPQAERWKASIEGKTRRYSSDLRRGLAQTLALMGMYGRSLTLSGGSTASDYASQFVRKLLDWASGDQSGQAWQSLADVLPLLAEAGPDAFLDGVAAAAGDKPLLATMFQDTSEKSGIFSGGTPHSNLLWALECVSWSPDHFGRAVDLLARLDEIDPGGKLINRPSASLAAIFRPWHPDNSVDPDRRIRAIDALRRRHPESAWKLELSMLPESHATHFPIASPQFRTWKPDKLTVTYGDIWRMTTAAIERCIEDAAANGDRWSAILNHISEMSTVDRNLVLTALHALAEQPDLATELRDSVWRTLTDLVGSHQEFPDADWALSEPELMKIETLTDRFLPDSAYTRLSGLFMSWTPHIAKRRLDGYEEYEREVSRQRINAIEEIEAEGGFDAILTLAQEAKVYGAVGVSLAQAGSSHDLELLRLLAIGDEQLVSTAMSYFSARYAVDGLTLVSELLEYEDLTVDQRARLLLVARNDLEKAWELAAADPAIEDRYWTLFQPIGLGQDCGLVDEVAARLLTARRHAAALDFLSMYASREDRAPRPETARLIVNALDGLLVAAGASSQDEGILSEWDFEQLFSYLELAQEHLESGTLARLQWSYLPSLGYDARVPTLSRSLAEDPEMFVGMVCAVYRRRPRSEDDSAEEPTDASIARNAYRLLNSWDEPPGLAGGAMDKTLLRTWLTKAVKLLAKRGRTEVGLQHFGQVLTHTPPDPDGSWPGAVVRDLIEEIALEHVETGLYLQILNSRDVTGRGLEDGGAQEVELAASYQSKAQQYADDSPRVAAVFRRVAQSYLADARRNEGDAERVRRGLGQ